MMYGEAAIDDERVRLAEELKLRPQLCDDCSFATEGYSRDLLCLQNQMNGGKEADSWARRIHSSMCLQV